MSNYFQIVNLNQFCSKTSSLLKMSKTFNIVKSYEEIKICYKKEISSKTSILFVKSILNEDFLFVRKWQICSKTSSLFENVKSYRKYQIGLKAWMHSLKTSNMFENVKFVWNVKSFRKRRNHSKILTISKNVKFLRKN